VVRRVAAEKFAVATGVVPSEGISSRSHLTNSELMLFRLMGVLAGRARLSKELSYGGYV
jgi:hypothetical protein